MNKMDTYLSPPIHEFQHLWNIIRMYVVFRTWDIWLTSPQLVKIFQGVIFYQYCGDKTHIQITPYFFSFFNLGPFGKSIYLTCITLLLLQIQQILNQSFKLGKTQVTLLKTKRLFASMLSLSILYFTLVSKKRVCCSLGTGIFNPRVMDAITQSDAKDCSCMWLNSK